MSVAHAIEAACEAGISLKVDDGDLVLRASIAPPADLLDLLSRHKVEIVAMLSAPRVYGWSMEDWQMLFGERSAIAEFDGGLARPAAETIAFTCCVREWRSRHGEGDAVAALAAMGIAPPAGFPDDFGKIWGA